MKKIIFILLPLCILATGLAGCDKEEEKKTSDKECGVVDINNNEYVTMQVTPEKVSINADSILLIIKNYTKVDMLHGPEFSLDYFDGQIWIPVDLDILFASIGYILKSGETTERALYKFLKYCNRVGKYRIKESIILTDNFTKASEYIICAEFEVY